MFQISTALLEQKGCKGKVFCFPSFVTPPPRAPRPCLFPAVDTNDLINLFVKDVSLQHQLSCWGDKCL